MPLESLFGVGSWFDLAGCAHSGLKVGLGGFHDHFLRLLKYGALRINGAPAFLISVKGDQQAITDIRRRLNRTRTVRVP